MTLLHRRIGAPVSPKWFLAILLLAPALHAQPQTNTLNAALSVNGTGKVDPATGTVETTNSQALPVPPGGAPLYWHRAQAHGALELRVQSAPGAPVLLASGIPIPAINLGGTIGSLELDPASLTVLVNGVAPANLLDLGAFIGASGSWTLYLGQGLPASAPDIHLQVAVFDPAAPSGVRLTGSVTLETRNDLDTLTRNFVDSVNQAADNLAYGPSLCSSGFRLDGHGAAPFFASALLDGPQLTYIGLLPNALGSPPPAGAPTTGQSVALALDIEDDLTSPCPSITVPSRERVRVHDLLAEEVAGSWKLSGNQRDAYIGASMIFLVEPPGTNLTLLSFYVENEADHHGGIATVSVTGPQLAGLAWIAPFQYESQSAAGGTLAPSPSWNGEEWFADVIVGSAGTSRQPIVPGDAYTFVITWHDGYTSQAYTVPLRAPVDPFAGMAPVVAAIPGSGNPATVLNNPGTPSATLAITFNVGDTPAPGAWSAVSIAVEQGGTEHEVRGLLLPASPAIQTVSLCVPGLLAGLPAQIALERFDVFGNKYARVLTATF